METGCHKHFIEQNKKFADIINDSFYSKHSNRLSEAYQFVEDLALLYEVIENYADTTILLSSIQEYELGFQAAINGQYRYAFIAQRYFVEQICRFIYLSTNELHLRHWKMGLKDISWEALMNKENGILSKIFIRAFFEEVDEEGVHIISVLTSMYRESSEFVHGNFSKILTLPSSLEFNDELLERWLGGADTAKFVSSFLLFMRFSKSLRKEDLKKIESIVIEELGDVEQFREFFNSVRI